MSPMSVPARVLKLCGEGEYRDEAEAFLRAPGDAALVHRGVMRSLVVRCPDGCGETLIVNLDPRAGKAWWLDQRGGRVTLYPSVWRDAGCKSHFIVWRGKIIWCDRFEYGNEEPDYDAALEAKVFGLLSPDEWRSGVSMANTLDEIPWDVSRAARRLVRLGNAVEGTGDRRDWFRRVR